MRARLILIAVMLASTGATGKDISAAREHYQRGTKLYDLQRYDEAAKEYEAAYEIVDDPALLFNIGQAYRFGGDDPKALGAFRSYLRRLPRAENRPEVESRIADLQKLIEEKRKSQEAPPGGTISPPEMKPLSPPQTVEAKPTETMPPPPAPIDPHTGKVKKITGLAVGVAGVAGIALGITFAALASSTNHELGHPPPNTRFNPTLEDRVKNDQALEAAFLSIGGAALVTGVVVGMLGLRESRGHRVAVLPSLSTSSAGASIRSQF
jgi:tetratricopeptide (TPR) repeat protein